MVAAFRVARHGPASSSAARKKTAARSSKESARQPRAAAPAAAIAAVTSASVALPNSPSTRRKLCGCTTDTRSPDPMTGRPPIVIVSSACWPARSFSFDSRAARSALPGWYWRTGSLCGGGTLVTASMTLTLPPPASQEYPPGESVASVRNVMKFLRGVPGQLVTFRGVHRERGVLVPRVGRADGVRGGGHIAGRAGRVDVPGSHGGDRDCRLYRHGGRLVVVRLPADFFVSDVRGEHHAAPGRVRVAGQQPQRLPGGGEHCHVFEFLVITARVRLAQRRGDRERAQRQLADLALGERVSQRRDRRRQVYPHGASW